MKNVLIVDDDENDLDSMKSVLENEGYHVGVAGNGAEAIDFAKDGCCDLILIDIQLPTVSGYDLLRLMRQRLEKKVKMAFVTVVPKNEVELEDIDGFVQKPFSPEDLLNEVRRLIG